MSKKALIICYYWPPAGGPGVQRWLKFVKYLPEYGITPIVYCPEGAHYPILDASLVNEIPKEITVLKQNIKEPYALARLVSKKSTTSISSGVIPVPKKQSLIQQLLLYIRGNYFIPDARKNWVQPSVKFLSKYLAINPVDVIITTGPPHSLHLIGQRLKTKFRSTWIADFRDPWTTIGYHKDLKLTKASALKHQALETQVLRTADHIIVTSHHTKREFKTKTAKPITVITNGYDAHNIQLEKKDKQFTLSHIGSLLAERNPKILWEVLADLVNTNAAFSSAFQLNLVGVVSDDVLNSIYNSGLKEYTNVVGYVSHDAAIKIQMCSQVLLLIESDSEATKAIIPGKVFEYLISKTPILALGPVDSDIEKIITTTKTGHYYNYDEASALRLQLLEYFKAYQNNELCVDAVGLNHYSRRALTRTLSTLVHNI